MSKLHVWSLLVLVIFFCCTPAIAGTSKGSIFGRIIDLTDRPLENVEVTVTTEYGDLVRKVKTNQNGIYRVHLLSPGWYSVLFDFPGYQSQRFSDVRINLNRKTRLCSLLFNEGYYEDYDITFEVNRRTDVFSSSVRLNLESYFLDRLP